MVAEEYEILPHKLLENLRDDVEALRNRLAAPDQVSNELILEIESLKDSIHDLHTVFTQALSEVKEDNSASRLTKLESQLDSVVMQNQTIAKGMLAISDKLDAFIRSQYKASAPAAPAHVRSEARATPTPRMSAPYPSASFGRTSPSSGMGAARPMAPRPPLPEFGSISPAAINSSAMNPSMASPANPLSPHSPSPMGMPPAPPPSPAATRKKHGLFGR